MLMDEIPPDKLWSNRDSLCPCILMEYGNGGSKESQSGGRRWQTSDYCSFWDLNEWWFSAYSTCISGKTTKCLPSFDFLPSWDITFSDNHWSNEQTMLSYFEKVIFPYLQKKKAELQLEPDHPALLLLGRAWASPTYTWYLWISSVCLSVCRSVRS